MAGNMMDDELSEGMAVEIVDLQRQPEMNGRRGICRQFDVNLRRWSIEVQCGRETERQRQRDSAVAGH